MTGRNTKAIVLGGVMLALGVLVLLMGAAPTEHRDADGYYIDDPVTFDRPSRAIVVSDIELLRGVYTELASDAFVLYVTADPVDLRIEGVTAAPAGLFMGIAPSSDVDGYLAGVAHDEVVELDRHDESKRILDVRYTAREGAGLPDAPGDQAFWTYSAEGSGLQTLDWTHEAGSWTAVVMNADASAGVTAQLAFGAAPAVDVDAIGRIALAVGVVALVGGGLALYLGLRRRGDDTSWPPPAPGPPSPAAREALRERSTSSS